MKMKLVIMAGGQRSTIANEETGIPKPMLEIGGRPLLWHIMKHASECGINDFVICGGYKVNLIKEYFLDYFVYQSDIMVNTKENKVTVLNDSTENWSVSVVDTGMNSYPIERIKKVADFLDDDNFIVSYGDCLSDINIGSFFEEFRKSYRKFGMAIAHPLGRKIPVDCDGNNSEFWTSAGMFILDRKHIKDMNVDGDIEEYFGTLDRKDIYYYKHYGYWNTIETLRDKVAAEKLWEKGDATWI